MNKYAAFASFLLALCLSTSHVTAQSSHKCATHKDHLFFEQQDPAYKQRMELLNSIARNLEGFQRVAGVQNTLVIIPVVVHVVHNPSVPAENISDAQINSQITSINRDFRRLNADTANNISAALRALGGDVNIEFRIARIDPQGFPTNGIIRRATFQTDFGGVNTPVDRLSGSISPPLVRNDVKRTANGGSDAWPTDKYLNMWVCNFVGQGGGQLLGYAQFPGGNPSTDGVVMWYRAFGSNNFGTFPVLSSSNDRGRTTTHEIGHWLGLIHIWGDLAGCTTDDQVSDTPLQDEESGGCPVSPRGDNCSPLASTNGILFQNYMDYSNDACMNIFTQGQVSRMRIALDQFRSELKTTESLGGPALPLQTFDAAPVNLLSPTSFSGFCKTDIRPQIFLRNFGLGNLSSVRIGMKVNNGPIIDTLWTGNLATYFWQSVTLPVVNFPGAGTHVLKIFTYSPNNSTDQRPANDTLTFTFSISPPNSSFLPLAEGFETGTAFPPANWRLAASRNTNNVDTATWKRVTGPASGGSTRSVARFMFSDQQADYAKRDTLFTPLIFMGNAIDSLYISWSYAYGRRTTLPASFTDTLRVFVSVDCDGSWALLRERFGSTLQTTTSNTAFVPTASQWLRDSVDISSFIGSTTRLRFAFVSISGRNNNLYIDDFRFNSPNLGPVGIPFDGLVDSNQLFEIFPNPASEVLHIRLFEEKSDQSAEIQVMDLTGKQVDQREVSFDQLNATMPVRHLAPGVYFIRVTVGDKSGYRRFIKD